MNCIVLAGRRRQSKYEFDLASVCNLLRMSTSDLLSALHQLKANGEIQFEPKAQGVLAEVVVEPTDLDLQHVAEKLHRKTSQLERNNVEKIDALYKVMVHFAQSGADGEDGSANDAAGEGPTSGKEDAARQRSNADQQRSKEADKRVDIQQIIDRYFAHYDEDEQDQSVARGLSETQTQRQTERPSERETEHARVPHLQEEKHNSAKDLTRDPWEEYKATFQAVHGNGGYNDESKLAATDSEAELRSLSFSPSFPSLPHLLPPSLPLSLSLSLTHCAEHCQQRSVSAGTSRAAREQWVVCFLLYHGLEADTSAAAWRHRCVLPDTPQRNWWAHWQGDCAHLPWPNQPPVSSL